MPRSRQPRRHCPACGRPAEARDLRGLITILGVVLTFALAFAQLFAGVEDGATIPPWAAGFLTLVAQGYYMTKGAERHAAALTRHQESAGDGNPSGQPKAAP